MGISLLLQGWESTIGYSGQMINERPRKPSEPHPLTPLNHASGPVLDQNTGPQLLLRKSLLIPTVAF